MPFFKKKKKEKTKAPDLSKRLPPDMVYSMTPRHGHGQDVVDENNVRQVAGCLPIDPVNKRFLLVTSSSNPGNWVIPKGGWEKDETQQQAAMRETWEEAGIKGVITRHIGVFAEKSKGVAKAHHWIYEMEIIEVTKKFPEQKKRERRWFTYEEARLVVKASFILDALSMSSLSPLSHPDCDSLQTSEKKKEKKKKKKQVSDDESSDEDAEEKRRKKERKKAKKREKKERKLKEAEEAALSDVDEDGIVLTNDQQLQRRTTRIDKAKAALQQDSDTDDDSDQDEKKTKKKKGKKGEITELQEQDMLFTSSTPLGKFDVTPAKLNTNVEERYEPIVQQLQQTHISPPPPQQQQQQQQQPRPPYPQQSSPQQPSFTPHRQPRSPPSQHQPRPSQQPVPHMSPPLMRPSQQRPLHLQRPPQFIQQGQPNYSNNPQRPMYNPQQQQQQQQRQPLFPPQGPNPQIRQYSPQPGLPGPQQRPMYPQPQGSAYPQRPSSHYAQVRQGKHHVVEDSLK